jgi:hypothetical protein
MRFIVPQFIEREMKVAWFFTFKQFIFIVAGAALCFFLYFTIAVKHFFLFLFASVLIMGTAFTLAMVQVQGRPLTALLISFIMYNIGGRRYVWKKKVITPKVLEMPKVVEQPKEKKGFPTKQSSELENLAIRLERGIQ